MKVQFFLKDMYLDNAALGGGVYRVDLGSTGSDQWLCLYVGEAGCMVKRGGEHIIKLNNDPQYFGLTEEDYESDRLILRFSVSRAITRQKKFQYDEEYNRIENEVKKELKPLTQVEDDNSDDMKDERVSLVQAGMRAAGFK